MSRGSVTELDEMISVSTTTTAKSKHEIKNALRDPRARPSPLEQEMVRTPGAGCKPAQEAQPGIDTVLESLLDSNIIGDSESPLTWTTLSTKDFADVFGLKGFYVSHVTVSMMSDDNGCSLRQNKKYVESRDPGPDKTSSSGTYPSSPPYS